MRKGPLLFLSALFLFLTSCNFSRSQIAVVYTDSPDIASIAELYNANQNRYIVEIIYTAQPLQEKTRQTDRADIIISKYLDPARKKQFLSLSSLLEDRIVDERAFYPALLNAGRSGSTQFFLPLSFNIPAFIFSKEQAALFTNRPVISLEEARTASASFNRFSDKAQMGYAPRWDGPFLFAVTEYFKVNWQLKNVLSWDPVALDSAIAWLRDWSLSDNGSIENEDDFTFQHLNRPRQALLQEGKILLSYATSQEIFSTSEEALSLLDFKWILGNGGIPVTDDVLWLGMAKKSHSKTAARDFIRWLYRESTWLEILEFYSRTKADESLFGIGKGLSALKTVNERIYPRFYPQLLSHLPSAESIVVNNRSFFQWHTLKEDLIIPWLQANLSHQKPPETEKLKNTTREWLIQEQAKFK